MEFNRQSLLNLGQSILGIKIIGERILKVNVLNLIILLFL